MVRGVVFDIKRYALHDGPGIRVTVFLKGCPLDCWWCHNPEGRSPERERFAPPAWATSLLRQADEAVGRLITVAELMEEIEKETLFLDESGGGVTFSGGEPLAQLEFLRASLRECKRREFATALDTSGYAPAEAFLAVIEDVDLFLYDLKLMDDAAHRKYTGVSNGPVLHNLRLLAERGKAFVVRFPVIPGVTDHARNVAAIGEFVASLRPGAAFDLLPYHRIGIGKYERMRLPNRMGATPSPSRETMEAVRRMLEQYGFRVHVGA
ncbi:MAG: glycyl-radical enzyme activating protein [Planctomycetota bacterium]